MFEFNEIIWWLINNQRFFHVSTDDRSIIVAVYKIEDDEEYDFKILFDRNGIYVAKFDCDPEGDFQEELHKAWLTLE